MDEMRLTTDDDAHSDKEPMVRRRTTINTVLENLAHVGERTATENVCDKLFPDHSHDSRDVETALLGPLFSKVVMITIVANCLEIGFMAQWPPASESPLVLVYTCLNVIFTVVYLIEVGVKMRVLGVEKYFQLMTNMLDFVITAVSVLQLALTFPPFLKLLAPFGASGLVRVMGLLRLLRIMRLLRVLKAIPELATTIGGLSGSMRTLGWVVVVLTICIYAFAIYFVRVVDRPESEYFKDLSTAMRTLTSVVVGDSWTGVFVRSPGDDVQDSDKVNFNSDVHPVLLYVPFYIFALLAVLGVTNIIVGVIVDSTAETKVKLQWANNRMKLLKMGKLWEDEIHAKGLSRDAIAHMSEEEADKAQERRKAAQLSICERILKQETDVFPPGMKPIELRKLLDVKGDGKVPFEEFCTGMGRLLLCDTFQQRVLLLMNQAYTRRRSARNQESIEDVQARMGRFEEDNKALHGKVEALHGKVDEVLKEIKALQAKSR